MQMIPLPLNNIRLGAPLPVALRDASGQLLLARGNTVDSERQLAQLALRGLYISAGDAAQFRYDMAAKVDSLLRSNAHLGAIAVAQPDAPRPTTPPELTAAGQSGYIDDPVGAVNTLMLRASTLLHDPQSTDFCARVDAVDARLKEMVDGDADHLLMLLISLGITETRKYSVCHALLVAAVCELAARHIETFSDDERRSLRRASLTMNIAMTNLQNQLVTESAPLTDRQRAQIADHAARGAEMMRGFGVTDPLWLDGVSQHHASKSGPLNALTPAERIARLIHRTDVFTAMLTPRNIRQGLPADAAARGAYLDENRQADEAGGAIIKALGIYPPGTFVRLANAEIAVVLRRGRRATEPRVASVISKLGTPLGTPAVRDTRLKATTISAGVATNDVKLRLNLPGLLQLA